MITREQYMADSAALHFAYFSQFVTPQTLAFVKSAIGLDNLRKAKDPEHLNGVPGVEWSADGMHWVWDRSPVNAQRLAVCGEINSANVRTCVGKAAAKQLLSE